MGCSESKSENITTLSKGAEPEKAPPDYRRKNRYPIPVVLPPSRGNSALIEATIVEENATDEATEAIAESHIGSTSKIGNGVPEILISTPEKTHEIESESNTAESSGNQHEISDVHKDGLPVARSALINEENENEVQENTKKETNLTNETSSVGREVSEIVDETSLRQPFDENPKTEGRNLNIEEIECKESSETEKEEVLEEILLQEDKAIHEFDTQTRGLSEECNIETNQTSDILVEVDESNENIKPEIAQETFSNDEGSKAAENIIGKNENVVDNELNEIEATATINQEVEISKEDNLNKDDKEESNREDLEGNHLQSSKEIENLSESTQEGFEEINKKTGDDENTITEEIIEIASDDSNQRSKDGRDIMTKEINENAISKDEANNDEPRDEDSVQETEAITKKNEEAMHESMEANVELEERKTSHEITSDIDVQAHQNEELTRNKHDNEDKNIKNEEEHREGDTTTPSEEVNFKEKIIIEEDRTEAKNKSEKNIEDFSTEKETIALEEDIKGEQAIERPELKINANEDEGDKVESVDQAIVRTSSEENVTETSNVEPIVNGLHSEKDIEENERKTSNMNAVEKIEESKLQ